MINITTPFSNEIKKDSFTYREYITVGTDTKKILVKAKLFDDCYIEGNFIGTFIMKRIEIETESDIDYKQKEITFYKGVKVGANWEDLKIGTFIVTDILLSDTKETVKITGYDYALKFAQPYVTALNYASGTITLQMVLDEITTALGLAKTVLDVNGGFIVDSNQFEGQQYGNVIQAIALSTGNFAKIDQNNNLKFIFKTPTDIVINDYVELEDKRDTHPITIVTLGMSQVDGENVTLRWEQGITLYGEHYLVINDNPFTYTQEKRQQQIQAIFDKIKGFAYSSFSTKSSFYPQVQCGDLIKIKNRAGTLVESIILRYSSDYDDILLEAPSIIKATVNYQNEPSLDLQIKNTQIIVNKALGQINNITKETNLLKDNLSNNYYTITKSNELIQNSENGLVNIFKTVGGTNLWSNTQPIFKNSDGTFQNWVGTLKNAEEYDSVSRNSIILQQGKISQSKELKNGVYSNGFKFKKLVALAKCTVKYNGREFFLEGNSGKIETTGEVKTNSITIEFNCDTNDGFKIYDLMLNTGDKCVDWQQNANESYSSNIETNEDITIRSSNVNMYQKLGADGNRTFNATSNKLIGYETGEESFRKKQKNETLESGKLLITTDTNEIIHIVGL